MNIKYNSKKIQKGDTFIALKTNNDGHKYINDAIKNGATKIVAEYGNYPVETLLVDNTKEYLVKYLYDNYYKEIEDLTLIGVTGTNGKTTTCMLIHNMLNKLGRKTAYIGTNGFYINTFIKDLPNTTPEIIDIYELLLEAKEEACEFVCIEASSHGLDQKRLAGLKFNYAIFTNLTHEHLGYHKTMEKYALAKQNLFKMLRNNKYAIINNDDKYKEYFLLKENNNITYSFTKGDYYIKDYQITSSHSTFKVINKNKEYTFTTKLLGKHNIYNSLASIIVLNKIGYSFEEINNVLTIVSGPKGRMENISYNNNNIIIDYAHTPDAVEKVLWAAKEIPHHKIYTIVGCGGDRDPIKRPIMGRIATDLSDVVIFTSDNPRTEDPEKIMDDILKGVKTKNYEVELDRHKAIKKGIELLEPEDILLILGKGHEDYQILGRDKVHFDDAEEVENWRLEHEKN